MHIGAQPVPQSLIKHWKTYFPNHQYDTNYGLSESIGPGCVHLGVENINKVGAIGVAGYGWECKIVDESRNTVKKVKLVNLQLKAQVMKCYYKDRKPPPKYCQKTAGFTPVTWQCRILTVSIF